MSSSAGSHSHTNRLAREKSPYLLQHQHNPVDWFAWGPEAFEKARRENKPIFLSIGYSTCHWCHVMERESFEDARTATDLNESFVCIKVDREERPDVDKIYISFVQAMTGGAGWPLNVFLTPDLKPFFGGTYWPPERKYGKSSFRDVLQQVARTWKEQRGRITESADNLHGQLGEILTRQATNSVALTERDLHQAGTGLKQGYDPVNGGFGGAPKFPTPSHPLYLLRYGVRFGDKEAVEMVLHTCRRMAAGGIHDHLGGGFARYAVDEKWLVPHFEKMLYDNAQLIHLYLDAHLVSSDPAFADVARGIVGYVLRDMTHPEGGFYSAEDADSEGKEGKFYCWTRSELMQRLSAAEFKLVVRHFGITEKGNFLDHSDPDPLPNQNVLSRTDAVLSAEEVPVLASAREKLFKARGSRVRPHLDDKVLTSWNGLMLGALARGAVVLHQPSWLEAAEKNARFVRERLWDASTRTLYHRWRDGSRDQVQFLDSHAFLLAGVLELYQATLNPAHLDFAIQLAERMIQQFYDRTDGGFWQSVEAAPDLILRVKEDHDGAEPSGNSVAALCLLKLAAIADRKDFREAADKTLSLFASQIRQQPRGTANMLLALDFAQEPPRRVVLAGSRDQVGLLLRAAHTVYQPNKVLLGTEGSVEAFARTLKSLDGQPTAYVCLGTLCKPPVQTPGALAGLLR